MAKQSASVPSGWFAAGLTTPRWDDAVVALPPTAILTMRLTTHFGSRGTIGSSANRSSGTSWRRFNASLVAIRISRRSVAAGAGSTVISIACDCVGAGIGGGTVVHRYCQCGRAVWPYPPHPLGEAGRQSCEQRVARPTQGLGVRVPLRARRQKSLPLGE